MSTRKISCLNRGEAHNGRDGRIIGLKKGSTSLTKKTRFMRDKVHDQGRAWHFMCRMGGENVKID